jgi:putative Mg2+ transporter-C (MgtC) family protein
MLTFLDNFRNLDFLSVIIKIVAVLVCGMAIGLERSAKNRPAGFRTHVLVCLGSAMAAMTGQYILLVLNLPTDITRISAQVITGLGFIGAGTILITKKQTIKGLTTAAGLWTTGIIGLAIGCGYYEIAVIGTILVLLVETLFAKLASKVTTNPEFAVEVVYNQKDSLDAVLRFCKDRRLSIVNLKIHTKDDETGALYSSGITLRGSASPEETIHRIRSMDGIVSCEMIW